MIFDVTAVAILISLALNGINLLTQFRTMLSQGEKKLDERLKIVEIKQDGLGSRVQTLEGELKHLPDNEMVQKLQIDMAEMKVQLTAMVKSSEATERATRRVEDFLMNKA